MPTGLLHQDKQWAVQPATNRNHGGWIQHAAGEGATRTSTHTCLGLRLHACFHQAGSAINTTADGPSYARCCQTTPLSGGQNPMEDTLPHLNHTLQSPSAPPFAFPATATTAAATTATPEPHPLTGLAGVPCALLFLLRMPSLHTKEQTHKQFWVHEVCEQVLQGQPACTCVYNAERQERATPGMGSAVVFQSMGASHQHP
jgi:hypothetical protein